MTDYLTTIELSKQNMHFAAAHFTIFSATEREHLHGHNYAVTCALTTRVQENGLNFDYRYYKTKMIELCKQLHQTTLLAANSKYLSIEEQGDVYLVTFNHKQMSLLKSDVTLVPVTNITVEELSRWFIAQIIQDQMLLQEHHIEKVLIKVFSSPGQSGTACWEKK